MYHFSNTLRNGVKILDTPVKILDINRKKLIYKILVI